MSWRTGATFIVQGSARARYMYMCVYILNYPREKFDKIFYINKVWKMVLSGHESDNTRTALFAYSSAVPLSTNRCVGVDWWQSLRAVYACGAYTLFAESMYVYYIVNDDAVLVALYVPCDHKNWVNEYLVLYSLWVYLPTRVCWSTILSWCANICLVSDTARLLCRCGGVQGIDALI